MRCGAVPVPYSTLVSPVQCSAGQGSAVRYIGIYTCIGIGTPLSYCNTVVTSRYWTGGTGGRADGRADGRAGASERVDRGESRRTTFMTSSSSSAIRINYRTVPVFSTDPQNMLPYDVGEPRCRQFSPTHTTHISLSKITIAKPKRRKTKTKKTRLSGTPRSSCMTTCFFYFIYFFSNFCPAMILECDDASIGLVRWVGYRILALSFLGRTGGFFFHIYYYYSGDRVMDSRWMEEG